MSYKTETDSGYQIKIPLKFRGYEFKKPCGKGKFASVVKVKDTNSQKVYAAKIIPEKGLKDQEKARKMINNEIEILQKANHPNVVQLYEIIKLTTKHDTFIILIEEYCPKGNLFDYINTYGFKNEQEKIKISRGITEGLRHLHSLGIAHCDIKPDNILIDDDMNPKFCDFNLSKIVQKADDSERGGSKAYAAPEIFNFEAVDFLRADIWSLGIMIFSISEKKYPYNDVEDARKGLLVFESKNKKMVSFVKRCLKVNPLKRATADDLLNDPYLKYEEEGNNENIIEKDDVNDDVNNDVSFLEKNKFESLKKSMKSSQNLADKKEKIKKKKDLMQMSMKTDPKLFDANKMKKCVKSEVTLSDGGLPPLSDGNMDDDDDELDDEIFEMIHGYRRSMLNLKESNESFTELTIYSKKKFDDLDNNINNQSNDDDNNNNSEPLQNVNNNNNDEGSASFSVILELGYDFELQNEIEGSILDEREEDDDDDDDDGFDDYEIERIENRICEKIVDFKYQKKKRPNKKGNHTKKKEKKNRKNEQDEE